ncbi:MAG: Uma2 family endonuclease [Pirellulales bacterium]
MSTITSPAVTAFGDPPLTLRLAPAIGLSHAQYDELCRQNPDLRLEQTATGEVVIWPHNGGESGNRSAEINMQLRQWAKRDGTGKAFDSNGEFRLPRGSARCPDASWVTLDRWNALSPAEREAFPPLCPDFVLELRSRTDRLRDLQDKLVEYMANGARLGWIVDPFTRTVHVYRPAHAPEVLADPAVVDGETVLPGFRLELSEIFPRVEC